MTKKEFIAKIEEEKPNISPYKIVMDKKTDQPCTIGCYNDTNIWKVYDISEHGDTFIALETMNENEAFDILYKWINAKIKLNTKQTEYTINLKMKN